MYEIIRKPKVGDNYIATIAIGDAYLSAWKKYVLPGWMNYCERYDIGILVVVGDLVDKASEFYKKATWQKMMLGKLFEREVPECSKVCYLDTDILISPVASNIFERYEGDGIGLVSLFNNIPFDRQETLQRVSALRKAFESPDYPLDSAIHMDISELYNHHKLPVQSDFACMGLIMFCPEKHAEIMEGWFKKYKATDYTLTGGDQTHYNFEIFSHGVVEIIPYSFQSMWLYEIANNYPFLYVPDLRNDQILKACIENTLMKYDFLHFAGSWMEGGHWKGVGHELFSVLGGAQKYMEQQKSEKRAPRAYGRLKG